MPNFVSSTYCCGDTVCRNALSRMHCLDECGLTGDSEAGDSETGDAETGDAKTSERKRERDW